MTCGLSSSIWRSRNGWQTAISACGRRAVARRPPEDDVGDLDRATFQPDGRQHLSSSCPLGPTNGLPWRSSSAPGASPISITLASGLPSAKRRLRAVSLSAQPSNRLPRPRAPRGWGRLRRSRGRSPRRCRRSAAAGAGIVAAAPTAAWVSGAGRGRIGKTPHACPRAAERRRRSIGCSPTASIYAHRLVPLEPWRGAVLVRSRPLTRWGAGPVAKQRSALREFEYERRDSCQRAGLQTWRRGPSAWRTEPRIMERESMHSTS